MAWPISPTSASPDRRAPRRWIDWSWAAHAAMRPNVRADRTAMAASPASASAASRSTSRQRYGAVVGEVQRCRGARGRPPAGATSSVSTPSWIAGGPERGRSTAASRRRAAGPAGAAACPAAPRRASSDLAGDVEERRREADAAGRRDAAVAVAEDHRHTVRAEQDAGVVAQVADDVADVEPGGEVRGDAAQRLRAPEPARGLLRRRRAPDEDAQRPRDRGRQPAAVVRSELHGTREDQQAPRRLAAWDPDDELVRAQPEDRRGPGKPGPRVDGLGRVEREREDVAPRRDAAGALVSRWPSTAVARGTRPPGRRSQMPTSAAPVVTRMRRQASSRAGSRPTRQRRDLGEVGQQVEPRRGIRRAWRGRRAVAPRAACRRRLGRRRGHGRTRPRPGTAGGPPSGSGGRLAR